MKLQLLKKNIVLSFLFLIFTSAIFAQSSNFFYSFQATQGPIIKRNFDGTTPSTIYTPPSGYIVQLSCVDASIGKLIFYETNVTTNWRIRSCNFDGSSLTTVYSLAAAISSITAGNGYIYYSYGGASPYTVKRINSDGTNDVLIYYPKAGMVYNLAYNATNNYLYFYEYHYDLAYTKNRVAKIKDNDLSGTMTTDPTTLTSLWELGTTAEISAFTVGNGYMYYSLNNTNTYKRRDLNGANESTLYTSTSNTINQITYDGIVNKIYFSEQLTLTNTNIFKSDIDGSNRSTIVSGINQIYGLSTPTVPPPASIATTNTASGITTTGATLNGSVNANNSSTTVTFQYGTSASYGSIVTAVQSPVTGTTATSVSKTIAGLTPNTTYHYRVVGVNAGGTTNGSDVTFTTTAAVPTATTSAATTITPTGATLNGSINANNASTAVSFDYGITTSYGANVTATQSPVSGSTATSVSYVLSGLVPNTTYHFRVNGVNTAGTTNGTDMTFTTTAVVPTVTTSAATAITTTGATLNGSVNANNASTVVSFDYGITTSYGTNVTATQSPVTGSTATSVSYVLSGLASNTTYHFRVNGVNTAGTTNGLDQQFTTNGISPTVTTQAVSSISTTTATGNGNITNLGIPNPTAYGVCWNTGGTPTISDSKADNGAASVTGAYTTSMTSLTANTTYYVRAFATNTAGTSYGTQVSFTTLTNGTFTATSNNDWATATNWAGGSVPTSATDVTIPSGKNPVIGATTTAYCNNLTVTGSLTIQSSSSGTGSLIVSGTSTGTITAERYMTGGMWHMVSPIAAGGSISTFIQAPGNAIPLSGSNYGMMDYNETTNLWKGYYTSSTSENFTTGKGYGLRRSSDGVVTFTGTLTSGTNTVAITKGGTEGWNLIGNPYTSSIYMNTAANSSYNFLKTNAIDASKLDPSYACIYLWDVPSSTYKILGNTPYSGRDLGFNVFAPGQAFFVKAASVGTVEFNKNMQVHQTSSTFKAPAATVSWPGMILTATSAATTSSTVITFNGNMTNGLDPTYDAGLLRGTNGLSLYTRLVEDNGVDFAIQCLPENYNNLVIPVGVDCKAGGDITFSAENITLPTGCNVVLEDKTTGISTSLTGATIYKATLPAETSGIGRFYIRSDNSYITGASGLNAGISSLKVYSTNGVIIIKGEVSDKTIASLYNLQGIKVLVNPLQKGSLNILSCPELMNGIYLLTILQNGETLTRKLILK